MFPESTYALVAVLSRRGFDLSPADVNTLRRAEITLRGWYTRCSGDRDDFASWAIERDTDTGIPYWCIYPYNTVKVSRTRVPDRETGAIRRVKAVCARNGLHYYVQSDPRGACLYISREPINDCNYTNGVSMYVPR